MTLVEGSVSVNGSIAYAAQQVYGLRNHREVANIIIFGVA
jgi:hypothetical protein